MVLPLSQDVKMTSYLLTALPESVLRLDSHLLPWLYENFINIYSDIYGHLLYTGISFQSTLALAPPFSSLDIPDELRHPDSFDIAQYCKSQIQDKQKYIYVYLDESLIPGMSAYQKDSHIHDSLLYGYDETEDTFYSISQVGYYRKSVKFKAEHLRSAYNSAFVNSANGTKLIPFNLDRSIPFEYRFSLDRFLIQLGDYINGNQQTIANYFIGFGTEDVIYGVPAKQYFISGLTVKQAWSFDAYRGISFIAEHSNGLLERLRYISEKYTFSYDINELLSQYTDLANEYEKVKILALKCHITYRHNTQVSLKSKLHELVKVEKELLLKLFAVLRTGSSLEDFQLFSPVCPLPFECIPSDNPYYAYKTSLEFTFQAPRYIHTLRVTNTAYIELSNETEIFYTHASINENTSQNRLLRFPSKLVRTLTVTFYSNVPLDKENLHIAIGNENLAIYKKATATSMRDPILGRSFAPDRATMDAVPCFWSAAEQWNKDDSLTVDLEAERHISMIRITERPFGCRIVNFSLLHSLSGNEWNAVVREQKGSWDKRPVCFDNLNLSAKYIRLIIHETVPDADGFSEPGIALIEVYDEPP